MALTKIDDRGLTTPIDLLDNEKIRFGTGNDLELYHDGDSSYINHVTSGTDLVIDAKSPGDDLILRAADDVEIRVQGNENAIKCIGDGAVELYYDNVKRLETYNSSGVTGIKVYDNVVLADDGRIRLGNATYGDLQLYHNGTNSHILENSAGELYIDSIGAGVHLRAGDNAGSVHNSVVCNLNAGVELYYDNNKKLHTTNIGSTITGSLTINNSNYDALIVTNNDDGSNGPYITLINDSSSPSNSDQAGVISFRGKDSSGDTTTYGQIRVYTTDINQGQESGEMTLSVRNSNTFQEKLRLKSGGDVSIIDGDLRVANGHGINFSDTSHVTGVESEVLDDYESGTWTAGVVTGTCSQQSCNYVKVGSLVHIWGRIHGLSDTTTNIILKITGLPYTCSTSNAGGSAFYKDISTSASTVYITTNEDLTFYSQNSSNAWAYVTHLSCGSNMEIYFHASYTSDTN